MKKYTWIFNGMKEDFFKMLSSKTYMWSIFTLHWGEECFFMKRNKNKFYIAYHRPYISNPFARGIYCKVTEEGNKTMINGILRMDILFILLMTVWYLILLFLLVISILCREPIPILTTILFFIVSGSPLFLLKGHPEKVINLMNELEESSWM